MSYDTDDLEELAQWIDDGKAISRSRFWDVPKLLRTIAAQYKSMEQSLDEKTKEVAAIRASHSGGLLRPSAAPHAGDETDLRRPKRRKQKPNGAYEVQAGRINAGDAGR